MFARTRVRIMSIFETRNGNRVAAMPLGSKFGRKKLITLRSLVNIKQPESCVEFILGTIFRTSYNQSSEHWSLVTLPDNVSIRIGPAAKIPLVK